jgi:glycosyltransferase involved in cell wall biosynthesis
MEQQISIAMASYNGAAYIRTQILSLVTQELMPAEIVIVDDGSNDDTVPIVEALQLQFPIISLHRNSENMGPVRSFKKAVSLCRYAFVALCDQDDIWLPDKLKLSAEALNGLDSNVPAMVYTDLEVIDVQEKSLAPSFWGVQGFQISKMNFRKILLRNVVTGCTVLMNGRMKAELIKMPAEVAMHDHWLALIAYGFGEVVALHTATVKYRQHLSSVTLKQKKTFIQRLVLLGENLVDKQREYLKLEVQQAVVFNKMYGMHLVENKRQQLRTFMELQSKSSAARKLYAAFQKLSSL